MFWKPPLTKFTYPSNKILLPLEQNFPTLSRIFPTPLWNICLPPHLFSGRGSLQKDLGKFFDFSIRYCKHCKYLKCYTPRNYFLFQKMISNLYWTIFQKKHIEFWSINYNIAYPLQNIFEPPSEYLPNPWCIFWREVFEIRLSAHFLQSHTHIF